MFAIPQVAAATVLQSAASFGAAEKMNVAQTAPNQVLLSKGNKHVAGRRVITVSAWDVPGGSQVGIEAWTENDVWGDINADPKPFVASVPRRHMWKMVSKLVALLGAPGATGAFQHF